jgi:hypothetical protein
MCSRPMHYYQRPGNMGRLCYPTQHPGRVQLPRASGARKLSRRAPRDPPTGGEQRGCKEGMQCPGEHSEVGGALFTVRVQSVVNITSVAVQTVSEPEICQGAGFKLRADARIRVQEPLQNCLGSRSKSKKHDKQLTHIVRVSGSVLFFFLFHLNRIFFHSKSYY